jgi:hypothetical protein
MIKYIRIVTIVVPLVVSLLVWAFGTIAFIKKYGGRNYSQSRTILLGWMWSDIIEAFQISSIYSVVPTAAIIQIVAMATTVIATIIWSILG